jgi:GH43 family beta-xylosidase
MTNFNILLLLFLSLWLGNTGCSSSSEKEKLVDTTFVNPVYDGADPWVIKKDGFYYNCYSSANSLVVSKSKYLTKQGTAKRVWFPPVSGWNRTHLWAPELHYLNGKWYIYYAAGQDGPPFIHQKAGVLESKTDDAQSEYVDKGMLVTSNTPDKPETAVWAIDFTPLELNGKLFGIWSGWEAPQTTDQTSQHLYIAPMSNPYTISGSRVKISSPVEAWETGGPLNLNEGPQILKNGDKVFIIYSCRESWLQEYRLGQLRLKSATSDPLDPASWEKSGPVFQGTSQVLGTGHASFTTSPDGTENWIVYHSKKSATPGWERDVRLQKFSFNADGSPNFGTPQAAGLKISRPSGEVEIEKSEEK